MTADLPPVTFVIEWENAIDVEDEWTNRAMAALERELAATADKMPSRPRIMYLYNEGAVEAGAIEHALDKVAPELRNLADVEIIPTPGLTYYKLKNFGIGRSATELTVMLDSDAAPQPGWLENLLMPFADPEIWRTLALALLVLGLWALIGLGVGILIPNQVAALLIAIGVAWIIEPILGAVLGITSWGSDITPYLPSQATSAMLSTSTGGFNGETVQTLSWWAGALVLAAYAAVMAGIGSWLTVRRDIS